MDGVRNGLNMLDVSCLLLLIELILWVAKDGGFVTLTCSVKLLEAVRVSEAHSEICRHQ